MTAILQRIARERGRDGNQAKEGEGIHFGSFVVICAEFKDSEAENLCSLLG